MRRRWLIRFMTVLRCESTCIVLSGDAGPVRRQADLDSLAHGGLRAEDAVGRDGGHLPAVLPRRRSGLYDFVAVFAADVPHVDAARPGGDDGETGEAVGGHEVRGG